MSAARATQHAERKGLSQGALVCFVGMDGSGKSTLARALRTTLEERGLRSRYVYGGFTSSFTVLRPVVALARATLFRGDKHYQDSQTKGRALKKEYIADFLCHGQMIVEIKAIKAITGIEEAQLLNYLKATNLPVGLIVNFGSPQLEWRRYANTKKSSK